MARCPSSRSLMKRPSAGSMSESTPWLAVTPDSWTLSRCSLPKWMETLRFTDMPISSTSWLLARRKSNSSLESCGLRRSISIYFLGSHTPIMMMRSEEHTSELQSLRHLVCRLLLEKKKNMQNNPSVEGERVVLTHSGGAGDLV